ncbi:MAG: carboxy terminal-processing peptidase [Opitutales bacterium]
MINGPISRTLLLSLLVLSPWSLWAQNRVQPTAEEKRNMQRETRIAIDFLQDYHLKKMPFVEIDSAELLTNYMHTLDEQRLYFLESDHERFIERFERTLKPSYLFVGDLFPAFEIYNLYRERVDNRLDWVAARLQEDFDLHQDDEIQVDRDELPWPASAEEADRLWEQRLRYDLISEVLENETLEKAKEKIAKRYERRRKFMGEFEVHNVQETFLSALTELYDPHSAFFSWDSAQEFDIEISNSLIGIGAQLRDVEGYCVVERVLPGGPAEQSGQIHPGDRIVAVSQGSEEEATDVVGMKLRRIVHMIRGEIGTALTLTIQPPGGETRRKVVLKRDRIELAANLASAEIFEIPQGDRTVPIGVIELPSFYGEGDPDGLGTSTSGDVLELLQTLESYGIEGLVLDLRRNGGGRLDEAVRLTGLFIEDGPVVMKRSFDGQVSEDWDENEEVAYEGPLVVLTSRMSASASEIMAGALKAYNRAVVVGDKSTYGKGTVQTLVDLENVASNPFWKSAPEWGRLKLTIQQFYLPDGDSTQEKGVPSDIVFPSLTEFLIETEGEQPYALDWDQIPAISFNEVEADWGKPVATVTDTLLGELRTRSEARRLSLPEFEFFNREIEWRRERIEKETFSLNLERRREQKDANEAQIEAFEKERKELGRTLAFEAEPIELTVATEQEAGHQAKLAETPLPNGKPRANQLFQKVFYYQETPASDIEEIWIEYINYDEMLDHAAELAETFSAATDYEVSEEQMTQILTHLKNEDRLGEFDPGEPFRLALEDALTEEMLEAGLPVFFRAIVELDDDILRERPILDVQLRESLRITSDWIELTRGEPSESILALAEMAEARAEKPETTSR